MFNAQWNYSSLTRQKNFPNWGISFSWINKIRQPFMVFFVLSRIFPRLFYVSRRIRRFFELKIESWKLRISFYLTSKDTKNTKTKTPKTLLLRLRLRLWWCICVLFLVCKHPDKSSQTRHQSLRDFIQNRRKTLKTEGRVKLVWTMLRCIMFCKNRKTKKTSFKIKIKREKIKID